MAVVEVINCTMHVCRWRVSAGGARVVTCQHPALLRLGAPGPALRLARHLPLHHGLAAPPLLRRHVRRLRAAGRRLARPLLAPLERNSEASILDWWCYFSRYKKIQ